MLSVLSQWNCFPVGRSSGAPTHFTGIRSVLSKSWFITTIFVIGNWRTIGLKRCICMLLMSMGSTATQTLVIWLLKLSRVCVRCACDCRRHLSRSPFGHSNCERSSSHTRDSPHSMSQIQPILSSICVWHAVFVQSTQGCYFRLPWVCEVWLLWWKIGIFHQRQDSFTHPEGRSVWRCVRIPSGMQERSRGEQHIQGEI